MALGAAFLAVALILLFENIQTSRWKRSAAVIVKTRTETYPIDRWEVTLSGSNTSVEYSYEVDGNSYTRKGIYPKKTVVASAVPGQGSNRIWILYNPRKPEEPRIAAASIPRRMSSFFAALGVVLLSSPLIDALYEATRKSRGQFKSR
jgi:hypothetical protein